MLLRSRPAVLSPQPVRHSRVAIDIETVGEMVRLTVTHDELKSEPEAAPSCRRREDCFRAARR